MTTCTQKSACGHECGRPHHATFHWPGSEPRPICWHHLGKAVAIAEQMGFSLVFEVTPEGRAYDEAMETVRALGGDPFDGNAP